MEPTKSTTIGVHYQLIGYLPRILAVVLRTWAVKLFLEMKSLKSLPPSATVRPSFHGEYGIKYSWRIRMTSSMCCRLKACSSTCHPHANRSWNMSQANWSALHCPRFVTRATSSLSRESSKIPLVALLSMWSIVSDVRTPVTLGSKPMGAFTPNKGKVGSASFWSDDSGLYTLWTRICSAPTKQPAMQSFGQKCPLQACSSMFHQRHDPC